MPVLPADSAPSSGAISGASEAGRTSASAALERLFEAANAPPEDAPLGPVAIPDGSAPSSPDNVHVRIPGLARIDLEDRVRGKPGAFDLLPNRYPDAVGLDVVLAQAANDPRFAGTVKQLVAVFEARTGVKIPPAMVNAAIANPARLADILAVTPKQLSDGMDTLVALYRQGAIRDAAPKARVMPQGFDVKDLANAPVAAPNYQLKELAPGVYQGDVRSALPDDKAKVNIAVAEIFDRLAENGTKPAGDRFEIRYDGRKYTRLDTFVRALEKNGHSVEISFGHRIANFADLKTKTPDGKILDIPAALLIRTGVAKDGEEAVLPAAHAEMLIRVKSNAETRGTKIDAEVKFFQGMTATGFFADGVAVVPSWCGYNVAEKMNGAQALKAIELAGLLSDVINSVAREQNLPFGAYGVTGVCMDSVEVVRHAMTGKLGYYPLLMRDQLLVPSIEARLRDHDRRDDPEYRLLRASIAAVPSDVEVNATARARMLNSIPWPEGQEPFQSSVDARRILREAP